METPHSAPHRADKHDGLDPKGKLDTMSVGYPAGKANIDARAGFIAQSVRDALDEAVRFKAWLDERSVADLVALGYTADEAGLLKASFAELTELSDLARGRRSQPSPSDFFWNAKHLMGVN
jgi:hypothetical protein